MFVNKSFLKYIDTNQNNIVLEAEPFQKAVKDGAMGAFHHKDFWLSMDNLRDNVELNKMFDEGDILWLKTKMYN